MNRIGRLFSGLRHPLALVFLVALLVRVGYLMLMLAQVGSAGLGQSSPDEALYWAAADSFAHGLNLNSSGVIIFGPGYPIALGIQMIFFGAAPLLLVGIHIFVSSLVALMIGFLAWRLTENLAVGVIAGLLEALSPTAITLSATFMSEPFFMVMLVGALLAVLASQRNDNWLGYLLAGLLLTAAALTRGVAVFFVLIIVAVDLVYTIREGSRGWGEFLNRISRPVVSLLIVAVGLGFWTVRNEADLGLPHLGMAAPMAMSLITCLTDADNDQGEFIWRYEKFIVSTERQAGDSLSEEGLYSQRATDEFKRVLTDKPLALATVLIENAWKNMHDESTLQERQLGDLGGPVTETLQSTASVGLNYRITVGVLLGLVLLCYRRKFLAVLLTGTSWLYFSLLCGLTLWQGPRVFYPASIGWTVLWAVAIYEIWWAAIGSKRSKKGGKRLAANAAHRAKKTQVTSAPMA